MVVNYLLQYYSDTYWFHRVVEWASYFKSVMDVKVIVGGINITLYPEESFSHHCFDYGIIGEAIEALPRLISALEKKENVESIEGLAYRNNGRVILNHPPHQLVSFDDYPFPARHLLHNHRSFFKSDIFVL